jgi:hypothetical protein
LTSFNVFSRARLNELSHGVIQTPSLILKEPRVTYRLQLHFFIPFSANFFHISRSLEYTHRIEILLTGLHLIHRLFSIFWHTCLRKYQVRQRLRQGILYR